MWDFPGNQALKQLLEDLYRHNKPIGAVCHGVAGLLSLQNSFGEPLIKGRKLTGFSNSEEQVVGLTTVIPFSLESRLTELGALYSKNNNFLSHLVVDGNIITGQNPASSEEVARKLLLCQKESLKRAEAAMN